MADPSAIFNTPPAPNWLDTANKFMGVQQGLNQNRLFQQQYQAREALGPILQSSIDPETGELDYNKAFIGMAASPKTAWMAADFLNSAVARQATQVQTANTQLDMAIKRMKAIGDASASLLGEGVGVKPQQVMDKVSQLLAEGVVDKKEALSFVTQMPQNGPDLHKFLQQQALRAQGAEKSMASVYGQIQQVAAGGETKVMAVSPMQGTTRELGSVEHVPTPAEASALVEQKGPSGETIAKPRIETAPMYGGKGTPITAQPAAPITTKLSPQQEHYQIKRGTDLAEYESGINENVTTTRNLMLTLEEARNALKDFKTGGGTETYAKLAQVAQAFGVPQGTVDKIGQGNLAAAQEFDKLAVGLATQQMKTMFAGSASKWAQMEWQRFQDANPRLETDPRAIDKIYSFMTRMGKLTYIEQDYMKKWKEEKQGNLDGFQPWFERHLRKAGIVKLQEGNPEAKGNPK